MKTMKQKLLRSRKIKISKAINIQVVGVGLESMVWGRRGGSNLHHKVKDLTMFGFATIYYLEDLISLQCMLSDGRS